MSRSSLLSTLLGIGVLLGSTALATLGAQSPHGATERAPNGLQPPATVVSAGAAQGARATTGSAVAGVAGPWISTAAVAPLVPAASGAQVSGYHADPHLGGGKNLALMGVGAAAVVIGLLVGDTAGTGIAVGGGLLGLYGLYLFLK